MQTLLGILFYVPGASELFTFLIVYAILALIKRKPTWDLIPRAILLCCAIFLALGVYSTKGPLYFVMVGIVACISMFARKNPSVEKAVLPITIFAYFACYMLFTFVGHEVIVPAKWSLRESPKEEDGRSKEQLVEFHFGEKESQFYGVYSDELAAYLKTLAIDKVEITVEALYHWGKLAGTSIDKINGKAFKSSDSYAGCIDDCKNAPYPKTFLGVRSSF